MFSFVRSFYVFHVFLKLLLPNFIILVFCCCLYNQFIVYWLLMIFFKIYCFPKVFSIFITIGYGNLLNVESSVFCSLYFIIIWLFNRLDNIFNVFVVAVVICRDFFKFFLFISCHPLFVMFVV